MGNSAIEPRPITSLPSPRTYARQAVLFLVAKACALRELSLDSKESPGFLKGRGLSLTTVRPLKSPVPPSPQPRNAAFGSAAFGLPVSLYRSKSSDCMADVVPNSYPKLDLLWDNVMRACGDGPALHSASASPGPSPAMRRVGTPTICQSP